MLEWGAHPVHSVINIGEATIVTSQRASFQISAFMAVFHMY